MVCEGILNLCGTSSEEIINRTKKEQAEYYQPIIDELNDSNRELKALNEKLTSTNKELASFNRQLTSSNKELVFSNKKLTEKLLSQVNYLEESLRQYKIFLCEESDTKNED